MQKALLGELKRVSDLKVSKFVLQILVLLRDPPVLIRKFLVELLVLGVRLRILLHKICESLFQACQAALLR